MSSEETLVFTDKEGKIVAKMSTIPEPIPFDNRRDALTAAKIFFARELMEFLGKGGLEKLRKKLLKKQLSLTKPTPK